MAVNFRDGGDLQGQQRGRASVTYGGVTTHELPSGESVVAKYEDESQYIDSAYEKVTALQVGARDTNVRVRKFSYVQAGPARSENGQQNKGISDLVMPTEYDDEGRVRTKGKVIVKGAKMNMRRLKTEDSNGDPTSRPKLGAVAPVDTLFAVPDFVKKGWNGALIAGWRKPPKQPKEGKARGATTSAGGAQEGGDRGGDQGGGSGREDGGGHSAKRENGAGGGGGEGGGGATRRPLSARPASAKSRPGSSAGQRPPPISAYNGDTMDAGVRAFREFCRMDEARPASASGRFSIHSPGPQPRVRRNPSVCAKIATSPEWHIPLFAAANEMSFDSLAEPRDDQVPPERRGGGRVIGGVGARRPQSAPAARRLQVWEQEQDGEERAPLPFARRGLASGGGGGGGIGVGFSPVGGRGGGGGRRERPWSASVKGTPKNSLIPYANQRERPSSARARPT